MDTSLHQKDVPSPQEVSSSNAEDWVEVTHPLHPWYGRKLRRQHVLTTGNVQLVRCIVDQDTLRCLPRAWTDLRIVDDFERVSSGRAFFRLDDLVALRAFVDVLLDDQQ
ncbi:MAG: DUF5372 family protein [Bacteroidetes bacterium]|nr:DUF5372 family protein [Bacteroidota bacterium]